jgi:hypothetical protein
MYAHPTIAHLQKSFDVQTQQTPGPGKNVFWAGVGLNDM